MLFITSDLHLDHRNIIKYCPTSRGHFQDEFEMTDVIINNWNSRIYPDDDVMIIGDLSFTNLTKTGEILKRLNGNKFLIFGNHDKNLRKKKDFLDEHFEGYDDIIQFEIDDLNVVFCHYPLADIRTHFIKNKNFSFDIYCHGHKHSKLKWVDDKNRLHIDCGIDGNDLYPHSWEEIKTKYFNMTLNNEK